MITPLNTRTLGFIVVPMVSPAYHARDKEIFGPVGALNLMQFDSLQATVENVKRETLEKRREILFWLRCMEFPVKDGHTTLILQLNPHFLRKDEILLQSGCLIWGIRAIIPPSCALRFSGSFIRDIGES